MYGDEDSGELKGDMVNYTLCTSISNSDFTIIEPSCYEEAVLIVFGYKPWRKRLMQLRGMILGNYVSYPKERRLLVQNGCTK